MNIQGACNHHCCFTFLAGPPGVMGDCNAIKNMVKKLGSLVEDLPGLYCAIGDCAYTASKRLIPIFRGEMARTPRNNIFNFYASQLCIQIKMAFGLMIAKKWGILSRPLTIKMIKIKKLMVAIARLHHFCINERLQENKNKNHNNNWDSNGSSAVFMPTNVTFTAHKTMLQENAAHFEGEEMDDAFENRWSRNNRDQMAKDIEYLQLTRPGVNSHAHAIHKKR
jgi:hypothetical protein